MTQQEKKNKTIAALTTAGVNLLLLLIMIFAGGWGFSGEGLGAGSENYGIEVNLGYDDVGTGAIEPAAPVGEEDATDDENPPAAPVEESENTKAETVQPTEEAAVTKAPETTTFTDPKSDVEIKEDKKEVKPVEKTVEKKPVEKVEKPAEKTPEVVKPAEKPKVVYKGKTNTDATGDGTGEGKKGVEGNEGDDVGKEGNKGVEGGREGAAVYKGQPGGGGNGGFGLQMAGWSWAETPKAPKLAETNVRGKIVFEITVDENGEITNIKTIENQLGPSAERLCRQEIEKLSLVKSSAGRAPERTVGRVSFNLDLQ
jgi:periplasmic protein TonB